METMIRDGHSFYIKGTDTDFRDALQLNGLMADLQEAACLNADNLGWGAPQLDPKGLAWMLIRTSVRMDRLPSWGDEMTVDTWSRGPKHLLFMRDYNIFSKSGEKIGAATSAWLLVDSTTHHPVRPKVVEVDESVIFDNRSSLGFDSPKLHPNPGIENIEPVITKHADFSEIDRNMHVNNTRYIAWCVDAAHYCGLESAEIKGVDINYISEIKFGSTVDIYIMPLDPSIEIPCLTCGKKLMAVEGRVRGEESVAFRAVLHSK